MTVGVYEDAEVVIVGGGVAGSAVAAVLARDGWRVLVLEKSLVHRDQVRGEFVIPWGVAELKALGLYEALMEAGANHPLRHVPYGEGVAPETARSRAIDLSGVVPDVPGSLCLGHPTMCDALNAAALLAGATILRGVEHITVEPGNAPRVAFTVGDEVYRVLPRLVVGADGRSSVVAQQLGAAIERGEPHHFLGGLLVEHVEAWPSEEQTIGIEGDVLYYVFPQGHGRARLYLGYARTQATRFAGEDPAARFLAAFRLVSLPHSGVLAGAHPAGPCCSYPNEGTSIGMPVAPGVVLIGDAAGYDDPTLGQGLSNAFHDVRLVSEAISRGADSTPERFHNYVEARRERGRRQQLLSYVTSRIRLEFNDAGRARRLRLPRLLAADPRAGLLLRAPMVGPHSLPAEIFDQSVWQPLIE
jgi:2-polyprenyl-6-methoxyphenol hydroxylase-like FAD-dependent oxidoreductase